MTSSAHERRDTVHAEGALLGIELNHAGALHGGRLRLHASGPIRRGLPSEQSRARAYGKATARCVLAGTDFFEIHAAHGYLIAQFLSPRTNHRDPTASRPTVPMDRSTGPTAMYLRRSRQS